MRITTCLAVLAATSALFLGGCTTNWSTGPQCGKTLPQDLPDNPDPCATYCKEWVPPVYRDVPRLRETCPARTVQVPYVARRTRYETVQTKPREVACRSGCGQTCEESLVQVRPGGHRWVQTDDGCWKYEYCCPKYKWCNRIEHENGIEYCVERPPEYETVAYTECEQRTAPVRKPAEYEVVYEKELYKPGHWRWRAHYDPCGPCTKCEKDRCGCRKTYNVVVDRKCKNDCVLPGCARTN